MASKENQLALDRIAMCGENLECKLSGMCKICGKPNDIETLQQAIDNEELYKKAFELLSIDYFNSQGGYYFDDRKDMKNKYLLKAKESEKQ